VTSPAFSLIKFGEQRIAIRVLTEIVTPNRFSLGGPINTSVRSMDEYEYRDWPERIPPTLQRSSTAATGGWFLCGRSAKQFGSGDILGREQSVASVGGGRQGFHQPSVVVIGCWFGWMVTRRWIWYGQQQRRLGQLLRGCFPCRLGELSWHGNTMSRAM
jgi:hypothetical protein